MTESQNSIPRKSIAIEVDDAYSPEAEALLEQGIAVIGPWTPPTPANWTGEPQHPESKRSTKA